MSGLVSMEIRPPVRAESHRCLALIPDTNPLTLTVRKLRGWTAMLPWTAVDLRGLCFSYRCVGAMGLPRDIIEEIIQFHHEDWGTLMACALTCRALFSAVRGLIHRRVRLPPWRSYPPHNLVGRIREKMFPVRRPRDWSEVHLRYLSMAGKRGLLGYTREVQINVGRDFVPESLEVYLPYFRSFTQVHTLRIDSFDLAGPLATFDRYFAQFVPTLRSLYLPYVKGGPHEVLKFICKFPHLDDLSLILSAPRHGGVDVPPRSAVECEHSPPLRGTLALKGWASVFARFLLKIPGGLHFRSINISGVVKEDLDEIFAACSSNLETLYLRPLSRKLTQHHAPPGQDSL